jgi:class 3 adenylate cyclase
MFCDLVGSTALSARLDPEDLRGIIAAYHRCCTELVERNAGFVAKYMGDGVLAYFGYPQAHEHDAERAVRAGLALIERIGRLESSGGTLASRVGIATGLVVVGDLIGSGDAQERGVVGETPNLAARLQAMRRQIPCRRAPRLVGWYLRHYAWRRSLRCRSSGVSASPFEFAGEAVHSPMI